MTNPLGASRATERLNATDRSTLEFLFLVLATAPALGSRTLTLGLAVAFLWTLFAFLFKPYALAPDRLSLVAILAAGSYSMVKVIFTLAHSGLDGAPALQGSVLFLAPISLIPYLRRIDSRRILDVSILGCGFSALLAAPLAAYQLLWIGERAQAGSGNAGAFAVLALVLGSIGTLNTVAAEPMRRLLGFLSWLAMVFCVLASGMRGIWLAIPLTTGVALWAIWPWVSRNAIRRALLATMVLLVVGAGFAGNSLVERATMLRSDVARLLEQNDYDSSTGRRLIMYRGALEAIADAPLAGYGIHGRMDAVKEHLPEAMHRLVSYTHPHNGFLAALLDAGILGLVALLFLLAVPTWVAAKALRDETWRIRMAAALILTTGYLASGMTNILFEHDLMDSAYIVWLVLLVSSVPRPPGQHAKPEALG